MTVRTTEVQVGQLIVRSGGPRGHRIIEPLTGCAVARGFATAIHAASAAKELDALADWFDVVKVRSTGTNPNCRSEVERIAKEHGGRIADGGTDVGEEVCAQAVARREGTAR